MSIFGIFFVFYILLVFIWLLPQYYSHFQDEISFVFWKFDKNFFVTCGFCFYLFLNQYTVIPICNSLQRVKIERIVKIIRRTDLICLCLYSCFTIVGFYSMPNTIVGTDEEKKWKLFLNRPNINGFNIFIFVGQILYGFKLGIGVFVKGHFLLMYFN